MKTPLATSILIAMTIHLLVSCGPKKETEIGGNGQHKPPTPSHLQGTSDQGGGGNLINGRPIDFYAIDITTLDEYKIYIAPIDQRISRILGEADLQYHVAYLETLAKSKTWYLIPAPLEKLQKERIGTSFQSDQGAFQTEKEVFLSAPVMTTLTAENRAKLLLHELIMAFFRVKFQDMSFYCRAQRTPKAAEVCLAQLAVAKDDSRMRAESRSEFLKPEEYESIRSVTQWLYEGFQTITREEFYETLKEKNFDPRIYNPSSVQYEHREKASPIDHDDFLRQLELQKKAGYFPKHCGFNTASPPVAQTTCDVSWEVSGEDLKLNIRLKRGEHLLETKNLEFAFPKAYSQEQNAYIRRRESFHDGLTVDIIELQSKSKSVENGVHFSVEFLTLPSSGPNFRLLGLRLKKNLWIKAASSGSNGWNATSLQTIPMAMTETEKLMSFIYERNTAPMRAEELSDHSF